MDTLIDFSWRLYPASAVMALGAGLVLWGTKAGVDGFRRALRGDSANLATWIWGFRLSIIGLALVGIGGAWAWHLLWLFVLSLAIGGEETLESSMVIWALRRQQFGRKLAPVKSAPGVD